MRRDHRVPRAAVRRRAARRPAGHLRLRRQRAPHRAGGPRPGHAGARVHPRRAQPRAWPPSSAPTRSAEAADPAPEPLDGAILFAPAGELVPVALRALDRGATLAVAGIWLSAIPALDYAAELFEERRLRSVTANTRPGRRGVPAPGRAARRAGDDGAPTRWPRRRPRSPTSPPVGSAGRPCCTTEPVSRPRRAARPALGSGVGEHDGGDRCQRDGQAQQRRRLVAEQVGQHRHRQHRHQHQQLDPDRPQEQRVACASRAARPAGCVLRQANALAIWPSTTAVKAAPEAVGQRAPPAARPRTTSPPRPGRRGTRPSPRSPRPGRGRRTPGAAARPSMSRRRGGRAVEHARRRRLGAQGERRQQVGADVEAEDLQHAERERDRAAGHGEDDERRELGDVVGQVVGEEPADVGERGPALLDGRDDRGEVVVEQHEVGGLPGDVGAADAHGHADVGLAQRRPVVDAVAGHRDDVTAGAQRLGDPQLVLRRRPGRRRRRRGRAASPSCGLVGRAGRCPPRRGLDRAVVGQRPTSRAIAARGRAGVAGDHGDPDAGAAALRRARRRRRAAAGPRGRRGRAAPGPARRRRRSAPSGSRAAAAGDGEHPQAPRRHRRRRHSGAPVGVEAAAGARVSGAPLTDSTPSSQTDMRRRRGSNGKRRVARQRPVAHGAGAQSAGPARRAPPPSGRRGRPTRRRPGGSGPSSTAPPHRRARGRPPPPRRSRSISATGSYPLPGERSPCPAASRPRPPPSGSG